MGLVPSLDHDHPQNIPYHIWEVSISAEAYKMYIYRDKGKLLRIRFGYPELEFSTYTIHIQCVYKFNIERERKEIIVFHIKNGLNRGGTPAHP